MAEAQSVETERNLSENDELTMCPICFEKFKTPKYLPCLHTFCKACLRTYIEATCRNKAEDQVPDGFKCPVCRREVSTPNISGNPSKWAEMLPVNHLIVTLMDKMSLQSQDKKCSPCARENETETAVSWCKQCAEALCKNCEKWHNRSKFTKGHTVILLKDMQSGDIFCEFSTFCNEHADELLKFYCHDHEVAGCSTCVTLKHRKCEHVDTLENASKSYFSSESDSHLRHNISDLLQKMNRYSSDREKEMQTFNTNSKAMLDETSAFLVRITSHLESLERKLRKSIEEKQKEEKSRFESSDEEMKSSIAYLDGLRKTLEITQKSGSTIQYFLECKRVCPLVEDLQKNTMETYQNVTMNNHKLFINQELSQVLRMSSFGTIHTEQKKHTLSASSWPIIETDLGLLSKKPHLVSSFQSPDNAGVQSALFLPDSTLLLGDRTSARCILTNWNGKKLKEISMPGEVSHLAFLNSSEILVSFYHESKLLVLDVGTLSKQREIHIPGKCYGVDATNEGLIYVSLESTIHCIDKLGNSKWKVSVPLKFTGDSRHIRVCKSGNIYYPDWVNHQVLSFDRNDKKVQEYRYKNINNTYGLDVDVDDNVYCCGYRSCNVYQMSPDGRIGREILTQTDGIRSPWCIQFQANSSVFLVGNKSGKEIQIYEMK